MTTDQGLVILDIEPDRLDSLIAGLDELGLSVTGDRVAGPSVPASR